jgi:hypothetical protein
MALIMGVGYGAPLHGQPQREQTALSKPPSSESPDLEAYKSPLAERLRRRRLSANERALEAYFERSLPQGWTFTYKAKVLRLSRKAPVYLLALPETLIRRMPKGEALTRAHREGRKINCQIDFLVERHDDVAIVRQKIRLYKEIRDELKHSYDRLHIGRQCAGSDLEECKQRPGSAGESAKEFITTRKILSEKIELAPLYRIGTLYLYPLKNQCVTGSIDWYFTNQQITDKDRVLPFEAEEEIGIVIRNLEQLRLWD